ncbi:MAG: sulfur carrier protein ThiS [Pyrinomonadaceae bacterium]
MKVFINGETREIPDGFHLAQLLTHFEMPTQRIAVERNSEVVHRTAWTETLVADGDRIEVIQFVGGG